MLALLSPRWHGGITEAWHGVHVHNGEEALQDITGLVRMGDADVCTTVFGR